MAETNEIKILEYLDSAIRYEKGKCDILKGLQKLIKNELFSIVAGHYPTISNEDTDRTM